MINTVFRFSLPLTTIPFPFPQFLEGTLLARIVPLTNVRIPKTLSPTQSLLPSMVYYVITSPTLQSKGMGRIVFF
jgi:hypothetical protein